MSVMYLNRKIGQPGKDPIQCTFHQMEIRRDRLPHDVSVISIDRKEQGKHISIPVRNLTQFVGTMLGSIGEVGNHAPIPSPTNEISVKLRFGVYPAHTMGHGGVYFEMSDEERKAGQYDHNEMFIHDMAASNDPRVKRQVEEEGKLLAYLLNRHRINKEYLSEKALKCALLENAEDVSV